MQPFKTYLGGKSGDGTYQRIISIMAPHDIYIDAFLGNSPMLTKKIPAFCSSIGIDLDKEVISAWSKLSLTDHIFLNCDAIPWLKYFKVPAAILKSLGYRILIYLDPPYRFSQRKSIQTKYKFEFSDSDHRQLLSIINDYPSHIVISSYPNPMYDDALKSWNSFKFQSNTRQGSVVEKIWFNYPWPKSLHDYRYMGKDFRDRYRIKNINSRTISKFKRMPDLERNYLFSILKNTFNL
jgi:DNA adenine methylase